MLASLGLAFAAGILSTLSPCVLPLLPIVVATAATQHRLAPAGLALGVAVSSVAIGLFVATIGFSIGLDGDFWRLVSGVILLAFSLLLVMPRLQSRLALAAGPFGDWADRRLAAVPTAGPWGQFAVGVLLGALWSPCVGPTLGAASLLAAQREDLARVAAVMALFGIGAALPLIAVGLLSRETLMRWRGRLAVTSSAMRIAPVSPSVPRRSPS